MEYSDCSSSENLYYRRWTALSDGTLFLSVQQKLQHFTSVIDVSPIDHSMDKLVSLIQGSIDETCPIIKRNPNRRQTFRIDKPYITAELRSLIKEKNLLYSKCCKRPITYGQRYRQARNNLTNRLRRAESTYYHNLLKLHISDSKKTRNVLNIILNRKPKSTSTDTHQLHHGVNVRQPDQVAEIFDKLFY